MQVPISKYQLNSKVWYCKEKCMISAYEAHKKNCKFSKKNIIDEISIGESKDSLLGLVGK